MKEHNKIPTLLIIILLLIVGAIVFFAHYSPYQESDGLSITLGSKAIDEQIHDKLTQCVQEQIKKATQLIGEQGFLYKEENSFKKDSLEDEMAQYLTENFFQCRVTLQGDLPEWVIIEKIINTEVEIKEEEISTNIEMDLTAEKEFKEKVVSIEEINTKVQLPLGNMLDFIQQFKETRENNTNGLCLTCLYDLAEENDLTVEVIEYTDSSVITVEDNNYNLALTIQGETE